MKKNKEYVYHFSDNIYDFIKPRHLQDGYKYELNQENMQVSAFPWFIDYSLIELLIKSGNKVWGSIDKLYQYAISIVKNSNNIHTINYTSSLEQREYDSMFYNRNVDIMKYKEKRNEYLYEKGIKPFSVDEFIKRDYLNRYPDVEEYFKYNAKYGSRKQYASFIPHLHIICINPLVYDKFSIHTKDYSILDISDLNTNVRVFMYKDKHGKSKGILKLNNEDDNTLTIDDFSFKFNDVNTKLIDYLKDYIKYKDLIVVTNNDLSSKFGFEKSDDNKYVLKG